MTSTRPGMLGRQPIRDRARPVRRSVVDDEQAEAVVLQDAGGQQRQVLAFVVRRDDDEYVRQCRMQMMNAEDNANGRRQTAEIARSAFCILHLAFVSRHGRRRHDQRRIDHGNPEPFLREKHEAGDDRRRAPSARAPSAAVLAATRHPAHRPLRDRAARHTGSPTRQSTSPSVAYTTDRPARPCRRASAPTSSKPRARDAAGSTPTRRDSRAARAASGVRSGCARAERELRALDLGVRREVAVAAASG